ncbi:MAG: hypothetical protein EAX86_05555 [Candidatus Heimdallarchaeota archaeon]|nr:hypothetical protein [Candidatus Heimdallarchaeota archaeon]
MKVIKDQKLDAIGKIEEEQMERLANRALILLSFKDTNTQNLRFVLNLLGIRSIKDKKAILEEIFRLIREGIVYVPKGLPQLLDKGSNFNIDNANDPENIDLCLLCPYDKLIEEIQKEIAIIKKKS